MTIPSGKLYRSKLLWPAMRAKYEPNLIRLVRLSRQRGSWEIRWRYPCLTHGFERIAAIRSFVGRRR